MKNIFTKIIFYVFIFTLFISSNQLALAQYVGGVNIQTNSATNISNGQANLNGNFSFPYFYSGTSYVWFQWGTNTGYSNTTSQQTIYGNSGSFSQTISGLNASTVYHFRAVIQNNNSTTYGQDLTFTTDYYGGNNGNGYLTITKRVINLSSGNLNWQASVNANPGDVLKFGITVQANNGDLHNVVIRDILPNNITYSPGTAMLDNQIYSNDIYSGINIGTIYSGNSKTLTYMANVATVRNFYYGTITLSNSATVTSNETSSQTASCQVIINNLLPTVYGATYYNTGITDNFFVDSFLLPIFLLVLMSWLYFTGRVYKFSDWVSSKIK